MVHPERSSRFGGAEMLYQTCGWKSRRGKPAGAPRSRLRVSGESRASERSVESPRGAVWLLRRGAKLRAECESVNFAAS
jgi:hypothetical protein